MTSCQFYKVAVLVLLVSMSFGVMATWGLVAYLRWIVRQWQQERELKHALAKELNHLRLHLALHDIDPAKL